MIGWLTVRCAAPAVALACLSTLALAQNPDATTVQGIARDWLVLTDRGDAGASWDAAARQFRNALPRERWVDSLRKAREPLGASTLVDLEDLVLGFVEQLGSGRSGFERFGDDGR